MIKGFAIFFLSIMPFFNGSGSLPQHLVQQQASVAQTATEIAEPETPSLPVILPQNATARSIYVGNLNSEDNIIISSHENRMLPIASLTKIMSAYVALQYIDINDHITVSEGAIESVGGTGFFNANEVFSFQDLLKAMMTASSNDAAAAVAEEVERRTNTPIAKTMNSTAVSLGMHNTIFTNPTGLDSEFGPSNYSTAYDISKLIKATMKYPILWDLSRDKRIVISSDSGNKYYLKNTNELAWQMPYYIGGKTGYTDEARDSVITLFEYPLGEPWYLILIGAEKGKRFSEAREILKNIILW